MEKITHILVVHGWGSSPERWHAFKEKLSSLMPNTIIHVPFVPGFDEQAPLKKPHTIDDYAAWLKDYIAHHKMEKPIVIGHSNGGRILMRVAAHNPKLISKLVLINAAGLPSKKTFKKTVFKIVSKIGKVIMWPLSKTPLNKLSKKILYKLVGESDYNRASPIMKKTMINMLSYDPTKDLKKIKSPTLLVWGEIDKDTPLKMGQQLHSLIKKSEFHVIPEARHNINITHPDRIAELLVKFIQK